MKDTIKRILEDLVKITNSTKKVPELPFCISKISKEKGLILKHYTENNKIDMESVQVDIQASGILEIVEDEVNYSSVKDGEKKTFKYSGKVVFLPTEEKIKKYVKIAPGERTKVLMKSALAPLAMNIISQIQGESETTSEDELDQKLDAVFGNLISDEDDKSEEFVDNEETIIDSKFSKIVQEQEKENDEDDDETIMYAKDESLNLENEPDSDETIMYTKNNTSGNEENIVEKEKSSIQGKKQGSIEPERKDDTEDMSAETKEPDIADTENVSETLDKIENIFEEEEEGIIPKPEDIKESLFDTEDKENTLQKEEAPKISPEVEEEPKKMDADIEGEAKKQENKNLVPMEEN